VKVLLILIWWFSNCFIFALEVGCDVSDEQNKSIAEIINLNAEIQKKLNSKSNKEISEFDCNQIINLASTEYKNIVKLGNNNYRIYLENFLAEVTNNDPEVSAFKKLMDYFQKSDFESMIKKNAVTKKNEEDLNKLLSSNYRLIRRTISDNPNAAKNLPTTSHDCDPYYTKENPQKVLDSLIDSYPRVTIYHNICSQHRGDGYRHPYNQKKISFETSNGQALVWFCKQTFNYSNTGKEVNYYSQMVTSKASCLAWDLVSNKSILGDQLQPNIQGKRDYYTQITDTRLEIAKSLGKNPLTYEEFLKNNPKLIANVPEPFFEKVVPRECMRGLKYYQSLHWANIDYKENQPIPIPITIPNKANIKKARH